MVRGFYPLVLITVFSFVCSACFDYDPSKLKGYDAAAEPGADEIEKDLLVDEVNDIEADGFNPEDVQIELDAADVQDQPERGDAVAICGNGVLDEGEECDTDETRACTGPCGTEGVEQCVDCHWVCILPADNNCDGVDDDCDTTPDDEYEPYQCGLGVCVNDSVCEDGSESCTPLPPESNQDTICDGRDEDCDGSVDEDWEASTCGYGVCERVESCIDGSVICTPGTPESDIDDTCNGIDEDCDGFVDEDWSATSSCGVGVCERQSQCIDGEVQCTPGEPESPSDTTCDGRDEDCDGDVDEDYLPYTCGLGVCARQSTCIEAVEQCIPAEPESPDDTTCDGRDEDCDGAVDDDWSPWSCGVGVCEREAVCFSGVESCTPGDPEGVVDEICDGRDEDCDGSVDEDWVAGTCGVGACQRDEQCIDGSVECTPGSPSPEICWNGLDDNCDGVVDDGCTTCPSPSVCAGAIDLLGANPSGGRFTGTTSGASIYEGSCGGAGPEKVFYFTVSAPPVGGDVDVFLTTHGSSFDTVIYVRSCECDGSEIACNDNSDQMNTSALQLEALHPGTYMVFVDGKGATQMGSFQLDAYVTASSVDGDRCGNPVSLIGISEYQYRLPNTTCNLSRDYTAAFELPECYFETAAEDMVFYFWVENNGTTVTIDACPSLSVTAYFDDTLYVRNICNSESITNQLGCDATDECGLGFGDLIFSKLQLTLDRGLYYLFVDAYDWPEEPHDPPYPPDCGEFWISISQL